MNDVETSDESVHGSDEEGFHIQNLCMDTDDIEFDTDVVKVGDWCLFEYFNDSKLYYVGKIITINDSKVTADFCSLCLEAMIRNVQSF